MANASDVYIFWLAVAAMLKKLFAQGPEVTGIPTINASWGGHRDLQQTVCRFLRKQQSVLHCFHAGPMYELLSL